MAFGQQSGPPASAKQVQELLVLLLEAGHSDFREARGPMGFTQRQAGGRFTRDEAAAFIDGLQADSSDEPGALPAGSPGPGPAAAQPALRDLSLVPASVLAAELQRRGWTATAPGAHRPAGGPPGPDG